MSRQQIKQAGFTIIEVVLVLAIAALIFLMVFIALPALQRSQRDDARKKDVSLVAGAVQSWIGNNRQGSTLEADDLRDYLEGGLSDNSSIEDIDVEEGSADEITLTLDEDEGIITVYSGVKCGEVGVESVNLQDGTRSQYAVVTILESGGGSGYCLDV